MHILDPSPVASSEAFCQFLGVPRGTCIPFSLLGHGEYNLNYRFTHPRTGDTLVLRIPVGSQMHLAAQARYEYGALELLAPSGRTPTPRYLDDTKSSLPCDFLVMDFLPGRPLRYETDLSHAAACLADIHNLDIPEHNHLIRPDDPLMAILDECRTMFRHYTDCDRASARTAAQVTRLLDRGQALLKPDGESGCRCVVNTELNSGNFLIGGPGEQHYLVDWEKPLYAYPYQDLGHFLAPTTTFWKTDTILTQADIMAFLAAYCAHSAHHRDPEPLWESTLPYFAMTCLRGITWCAMAWVEYNSPDRLLKDAITYRKIESYLAPDFLDWIEEDYLDG